MSEKADLESRVADLEVAVDALLELVTTEEATTPGQAMEQMHQRFRQRLREPR